MGFLIVRVSPTRKRRMDGELVLLHRKWKFAML
jgi:hypothetical protein